MTTHRSLGSHIVVMIKFHFRLVAEQRLLKSSYDANRGLFCEVNIIKADTHEGFCSRSMLQDHFARVSTHEGALFAPGACSQVFNRLNIVEHFCGVEILLPRMKYTHEIVGTHGGALLPERAPGACSGSKTPRVYRP